jgi:type IV fimbrial biogenesis protein FimT
MRHLIRTRAAARGFTLIELMIGLAIGAMLLLVGAPYFGDYVTNSRLRESGNTLFAEALFAQSEAIKRNATMRVVVSGDKLQTFDMLAGGAGTLVREVTLTKPVTAVTNVTFSLSSDGRPSPFGTSVAANLAISGMTCSSDARCPGLRIDAGGAIRLCGNHLSGCD